MSLVKTFFYKDNKLSKTAIFLTFATLILLLLWPFQALFVGVEFFGWWTIPAFSAGAATSVMGILSTLYVVNHNWRSEQSAPTKEDFDKIRQDFDGVVNSIKRED